MTWGLADACIGIDETHDWARLIARDVSVSDWKRKVQYGRCPVVHAYLFGKDVRSILTKKLAHIVCSKCFVRP